MVRIGIPSAMFYYSYYPMWCVFLEGLGFQIINSGPTTEAILDQGVQVVSTDACMPLKIFLGHVMVLKDRVDYLFIPRLVSLNKKTTYCPYFLGLPDMVRHLSVDLPPIIDVRFDMRNYRHTMLRAFYVTGKLVGASRLTTFRAYIKARYSQMKFQFKLYQGYQPAEAMDIVCNRKIIKLDRENMWLTVAIIGYPYLIHDPLVSGDIIASLRKSGIRVVTSDNLTPWQINRQRYPTGEKRLWTLSDRVLRAAYYFINAKNVDALIHITSKGCHPDIVLDLLIQDKVASQKMPFASLAFDDGFVPGDFNEKIDDLISAALQVKKRKLQS